MALALDIMKGGFSAQSSKAIQGQVNSAVTAAGSAIGTATDLTMSMNIVTAGTGGVQLPNGDIGDEVEILNLLSVAITVYPPSSQRVNALAADSGFLLASNTAVKVKKFTATRWMGFLSA